MNGEEQIPAYYNMPMVSQEQEITNIVAQIDPKTIIDNLDHALRGEHYDKENMEWKMNASGKPIVNDSCRGSIISYLDSILTNNTTMGNIDEKRFSLIMESVISTLTKMFIANLEEFGFVPPAQKKILCEIYGDYYFLNENQIVRYRNQGVDIIEKPNIVVYDTYENRGLPDSARMTLVSNMVCKVCYFVFSRALKGQESIRIFKSLKMADNLMYGDNQRQQSQGWLSKMFGR